MVLNFLKRKPARKRVLVVGLDGTPYTFLRKLIDEGHMPNLALLEKRGSLRQMRSSLPCVSSVAWTSFNTGKNPGKHGIYGFIDKMPGTYDTYIPTSRHVAAKPIWQILTDEGKKVIMANVPISYPPDAVNGILISDFLTPELKKGVQPPDYYHKLEELGYQIDIDTQRAQADKSVVPELFKDTFASRKKTLYHFYKNEEWDFLMMLFMETDRLHHFVWGEMDAGDPKFHRPFMECYELVDEMLGEVSAMLEEGDTLMIMSDHGFCSLDKEVYINNWLIDEGYLVLPEKREVKLIDERTRAFSLDPGRIYLNVNGREQKGSVELGSEYENLRDEIALKLMNLKDPENGREVVQKIYKKEDIYSGNRFQEGPDLVILPQNGYDIKGALNKETLFGKQNLSGMHTYEDAMFYISSTQDVRQEVDIIDILPTILDELGVQASEIFDGRSLVK